MYKIIISGNSDSRVLVNADVDGGLLNYFMFSVLQDLFHSTPLLSWQRICTICRGFPSCLCALRQLWVATENFQRLEPSLQSYLNLVAFLDVPSFPVLWAVPEVGSVSIMYRNPPVCILAIREQRTLEELNYIFASPIAIKSTK